MCNDLPPKAVCRSDLAVVSMCFLLSAHGDLRAVPCEFEFGGYLSASLGVCIQSAWTHWDLSPGPSTCEADLIPLRHVPLEGSALHVHGAATVGEVSWLWAQQEKSGPSVVQDDKKAAGRFRKMLPCPQQPKLYLEPKWLR